jgi:PAS domain S-box-containing protein
MKFLIIGEPNPRSEFQKVVKECFPVIEFSFAYDPATLDQSLSQDGYDLIFIEMPLDRAGSPDLLQKLQHRRGNKPPVLVSPFEQTDDLLRPMLEALPDWVEWLGADGHYRLVSSACETITGYRPEDFMSNPNLILELVHPDDRQRMLEHRREILAHANQACEFEFRLYHRNGELRWISHKYQPMFREGTWIGHFATNRDITVYKKTVEDQHLSQQALLALMNAPSDVIILVDRQYRIVHVNQTLANRFGIQVDEIVGKHILDVLPLTPELARTREAITRRVFKTGEPQRNEDVGLSGVFDNQYLPILDEQGQVKLVAVIARDITQRKQIEDELRHSNKIIQALLNAPSDIAVVFDLDGKIQMVNETLAGIYKRNANEMIGGNVWDYLSPEMTKFRKTVFEKVIQTRKPERVIDSGPLGHFDSIIIPILDVAGNVTQVAILARDISERIRAQEALSQREAMLSTIVNNAPVVLFVFDKDGNITFADGKAISVATHLEERLIGLNILNFTIDNPVFAQAFRQAMNGQDYSTQITTESGFTFETRLTPLRNPDGAITGIICVGVDITENQNIQEELRHSKEELQVILDGVAETIAVINPQGELVYINQAGIQLTGYDSMLALAGDIGHPDFLNLRDEAGNPISLEKLRRLTMFRGAVKDASIFRLQSLNSKEERWISAQSTPIYDNDGELQFIVLIAHDLTEIKHHQAQLEAAQVELEKKIVERTSELNRANQELVQRVAERQRAAAHAEALAHVAAQVNLQTDLPSTLQAICDEITKAVKYAFCSIFLYDEQKDEFRLATSNSDVATSDSVEATPRALYEHYLRMYGPVIVIPDRQALPEVQGAQMMVQYDIRTLISLPLVSNGELIGNLNVASTNEVRLPSQEELTLLVALADQASIAISKARLFEQVSESRKRLQFLSDRLVEIQEAERRNLAIELHDQIGQMLTSLRLNLDLAVRSLPAGQLSVNETHKQLNRANDTAAQLLSRIREISLDLRPTLLDDLGLLPALLVQFERFTARTSIQVHFKHSGLENRFSSPIETAAFRVIQEALTNIARHAKTGEAFVRLWVDSQFLRLQVEDHGVGFDPQVALTSNLTSGLSGMQERVSLCNGQFEIESEPGMGTCLTVELPLSQERLSEVVL